jgi:hypothetical protein
VLCCPHSNQINAPLSVLSLCKRKKAEKRQVKQPGPIFQKAAIGEQTKKLKRNKKVPKKEQLRQKNRGEAPKVQIY